MTSPQVLQKLQIHIQQVQDEPSTKFDTKLLEQCEIYFSSVDPSPEELKTWEALFFQIAQLLPVLQQDPSPISRVILKLSHPLAFDHLNKLDLVPGLDLSATAFHRMAIELLEKATRNSAHVELLAGNPDLIAAIVKLWLCVDDTGVALKADNLLLDFLKLSKNLPSPIKGDSPTVYGQGPMWKRLFGDRDIFRLFFSICSSRKDAPRDVELSMSQRTVAQARLMDWLPRVGVLDWDTLLRCHHVDIVTDYGLETGDGLLKFAAEEMVDYKDDVLMHVSLINFYSSLLLTVTRNATADMSVSLQYLISRRLHHRAMSYWLSPNPNEPLEASYLTGPSALYISTYASTYPEHFELSDLSEIHAKLQSLLDLSPGRWAQGQSPKHELQILSSLPRTSLFPSSPTNFKHDSPLALIPCKTTNEDALAALATIFHGPPDPRPSLVTTYPPASASTTGISDERWLIEAEAAGGLFWLYFFTNPSLFQDLIAHAEIVALKDKAIAAISLIRALATATWTRTVPDAAEEESVTITASSEAAAHAQARVITFTAANVNKPETGIEALLWPPIRNVLFPFLFKVPQKLSGLVGGHGDAESAAYKLATARFDLVTAVHGKLSVLVGEQSGKREWVALKRALGERIAGGPWGVGAETGGRIATMEL